MRRLFLTLLSVGMLLAIPGPAAGHEQFAAFDHPTPGSAPSNPYAAPIAGGPGAVWEPIKSIATGNPHSDIDFFTQGRETYASAGTLAVGPNAAGQSIVKLTENGEVTSTSPQFVAGHGSAECPSDPQAALGLQHDVEATPKGNVLLNTGNPFAVRRSAQLIIDASDNEGRCHDGGTLFGLEPTPQQGGLEIVDITDIDNPVEIGLTSHIGEAHTVNIDPKRPHIAYAVTSDQVGVEQPGNKRLNEVPGGADRNDLDGFEVVDLSSCMNFPPATTIQQKRNRCRPTVHRFRYPSARVALGHTVKDHIYGCHELEVYPSDRLTCGSGGAAILFDVSAAFDDNGTPLDFTDDKPRGRPLPCRVRDSSTAVPLLQTGAKVTDCVNGRNGQSLDVPSWRAIGSPSLQGVDYVGSIHHMGRGGPRLATQDNDFDHEAELSGSRRLILATDERGGGVTPPGATCPTSPVDNPLGNGGVHAYRVNRLTGSGPGTVAQADAQYARTPGGAKAIYRATIRTQPQVTVCTAHVFHQIPGQNRIFMGWYSQGTQVVDFIEGPNGTVRFREAGFFLPANANSWVSAVFKMKRNPNGSFTYWGATGDFNLATAGRNSIDVYKVTLPPPPKPLPPPGGGGGDDDDDDDDD
jgi:hypothetical protein